MELHAELMIDATPGLVWDVVGERFGQVAEWATPILTSRLLPASPRAQDGAEPLPVEGALRVCGIGGFGPFPAGEVVERLTMFDRGGRRLEYRAERGMPRMVRSAVNRWSVHPVPGEEGRCVVRVHATLRPAWWMLPMRPFLARQLGRGAREVLQDLRHRAETGRPRQAGPAGRQAV